jgi:hypothetical protein
MNQPDSAIGLWRSRDDGDLRSIVADRSADRETCSPARSHAPSEPDDVAQPT